MRKLPPIPASDFSITPSKDEIAFFRENGFLVLDRITTDEEIDWLREVFEHIFDPANANEEGAPIDRSGVEPGTVSLLSQCFYPEMQHSDILKTAFRRNARRYAAALLNETESDLSFWGHMIKKGPGGRSAPWHQDHGYWEPELNYNALGVWLPLHDVTTEMGAMQFIPGSHKMGLLTHRHEEAPETNILTVEGVTDVDLSKAVSCPLKKGGATFHHAETLHYTAPNTTQTPRLAFPMEFQIKPTRREAPEYMPWVMERRAATGRQPSVEFPADGAWRPI